MRRCVTPALAEPFAEFMRAILDIPLSSFQSICSRQGCGFRCRGGTLAIAGRWAYASTSSRLVPGFFVDQQLQLQIVQRFATRSQHFHALLRNSSVNAWIFRCAQAKSRSRFAMRD